MRLFSRLLHGIRTLLRRGIADEELDAELHAFLEAAVDEKVRSGMSREQASRAARLELGLVSAESVKDRVRDVGWESSLEASRGMLSTLCGHCALHQGLPQWRF